MTRGAGFAFSDLASPPSSAIPSFRNPASHPFVACIQPAGPIPRSQRKKDEKVYAFMLRFNNLLILFLQPNFFLELLWLWFHSHHSAFACIYAWSSPFNLGSSRFRFTSLPFHLASVSPTFTLGFIGSSFMRFIGRVSWTHRSDGLTLFFTSLGLEGSNWEDRNR